MNWDVFALGMAVGQLTMLGMVLLIRPRSRATDLLARELMITHPMGTEIPTALHIVPDQWPDVWDDPTSGRGPRDGARHGVEMESGDERE